MSAPRDPLAEYFTREWWGINPYAGLPVMTSRFLPPDVAIIGYPDRLRDAFARARSELLIDGDLDPTMIVYRDEYERMSKAFWSRLDPQLRRLEHETRAQWEAW